jgi:hypothetical protein
MKTAACLVLCMLCFLGGVAIQPAMAQNAATDPLINLAANNQPLGDVLATITRDTGYRFNLNGKWKDHPVSATINGVPLEQGLKRLLRSLNHTIIWESDKRITIMVFGKADPARPGSAISFSAPPQPVPVDVEPAIAAEDEPADEPEPAETGIETPESDAAAQESETRQPGNAEPKPEAAGSE